MRIVAATDLTAPGRRVVDLASTLARALGAPLTLVHVTDLPPEPSAFGGGAEIEPALEALRDRVRRRVDQAAEGMEAERARCAARGVECEVRLLEGHPWEVILEEATRVEAGLLVVGSHGSGTPSHELRERIKERLLGSTADRVVRHAPCPVLVVTGEAELDDLRGAKWLVGVDFSPASESALRFARELAEQSGGTLVLAHAVAPSGVDLDEGIEPNWQQLLREESRKEAERQLRALAEAEAGGAAVYQGERVSHGPPADELCQALHETGSDVLVVGSHGKKGLTRLLLGSTTERCLRRSDRPILVVGPG